MRRNSWTFVRNNGCLDTGLLEPPKYWGYGIYIDFRFALPIPFFVYLSMVRLTHTVTVVPQNGELGIITLKGIPSPKAASR